jgi:hypothetical protein
MQFYTKKYKLFLLLLFCCTQGFSQEQLNVQLNRSFFKAGDTIVITATQNVEKKNNATLFLMAVHEEGMIWKMRWPMLNGRCASGLIIPDSLPAGQYRFRFSVLQNLFTVFGKVKTPAGISLLNSTLVTASGDLYESEVEVKENGSFSYKNVLFPKEATILFTLPEQRQNSNLNIQISTVLDSVVSPGNETVLDVYVGET